MPGVRVTSPPPQQACYKLRQKDYISLHIYSNPEGTWVYQDWDSTHPSPALPP